MASKKIVTYKDLLSDVYYPPKDIDCMEVLQLLRQAESIPQYLLPFKGCIQVIDYTQHRHVALNGPFKNMTGYDPRDVIENGLDFVIDIFQKDDFKIYNEMIFGQATEFLCNNAQEEHSSYLFTYSYRSRRVDGKWMQIFQQGSYITDSKSKQPHYGIAFIADISPLKKDTSMIFSIDKKTNEGGLCNYTNLLTNYYYPEPEESKLSKREREIVGRLADGLSSKQIAGKLFISENTVVNHRKKILKKTNTRNVAELIRHAYMKGII
ncbi:hypothetical protein GS399_15855 [Pedobacter sp. HMF7647]|uniref:HTH luxR-type domain-containing protein n=1 Tax=Hufsiella arboris TaxID=2695275 RepID=A0A7K1YDG7_9SPHI|nr:helix-turn-helix transcriptional regulator [Hufsiella arboris]MXV52450.1 hypothetical protein [Hufsiella arboris]